MTSLNVSERRINCRKILIKMVDNKFYSFIYLPGFVLAANEDA